MDLQDIELTFGRHTPMVLALRENLAPNSFWVAHQCWR
jgi:hypothetical protein